MASTAPITGTSRMRRMVSWVGSVRWRVTWDRVRRSALGAQLSSSDTETAHARLAKDTGPHGPRSALARLAEAGQRPLHEAVGDVPADRSPHRGFDRCVCEPEIARRSGSVVRVA